MLPENIDLTENRDFGGSRFRGDRFQLIEMGIPTELWEDNMTSEDYKKIRRWRNPFVKRTHTNEKYRIFGTTSFVKKLESHCFRCGKELKLPWVREKRELCKQCSDEIEHNNQYSKFPWNCMKLSVSSRIDLFNLR